VGDDLVGGVEGIRSGNSGYCDDAWLEGCMVPDGLSEFDKE
jgi:hypothetical protein